MSITIALAGNPNCGKTTLFNDLTGSNQYVGCLLYTSREGQEILQLLHIVGHAAQQGQGPLHTQRAGGACPVKGAGGVPGAIRIQGRGGAQPHGPAVQQGTEGGQVLCCHPRQHSAFTSCL